jgi:hypothetical protein
MNFPALRRLSAVLGSLMTGGKIQPTKETSESIGPAILQQSGEDLVALPHLLYFARTVSGKSSNENQPQKENRAT